MAQRPGGPGGGTPRCGGAPPRRWSGRPRRAPGWRRPCARQGGKQQAPKRSRQRAGARRAAAGAAEQRISHVRAAVRGGGPSGLTARVAVVATGQAAFADGSTGAGCGRRGFRALVLARRRRSVQSVQGERRKAPAQGASGAPTSAAAAEGGAGGGPEQALAVAPDSNAVRGGPRGEVARAAAAQAAGKLEFQSSGDSLLGGPAHAPLPAIPDLISLLGSSSPPQVSDTEREAPDGAWAEASEAASSGAASQGDPGEAAADTSRSTTMKNRKAAPPGTAWRDGTHMTIPMTTLYELNPETGQARWWSRPYTYCPVPGKQEVMFPISPCYKAKVAPKEFASLMLVIAMKLLAAGGPRHGELERLHSTGAGRRGGR